MAFTYSPHSASGTPITATSATLGCVEEIRFHFGRVDVDAARDDHVALAAGQEQEAVGVEVADVAEGEVVPALDVDAVFSGSLKYSAVSAGGIEVDRAGCDGPQLVAFPVEDVIIAPPIGPPTVPGFASHWWASRWSPRPRCRRRSPRSPGPHQSIMRLFTSTGMAPRYGRRSAPTRRPPAPALLRAAPAAARTWSAPSGCW